MTDSTSHERRANDVEIAMLRKDFESLTETVAELNDQVRSLVLAWQTAGYLVSIVKWLAVTGTAVTAFWASMKGFSK